MRIKFVGHVAGMGLYKHSSHKSVIIIIIIIIFINAILVVSRWQWLFYMYTKYEIGY